MANCAQRENKLLNLDSRLDSRLSSELDSKLELLKFEYALHIESLLAIEGTLIAER